MHRCLIRSVSDFVISIVSKGDPSANKLRKLQICKFVDLNILLDFRTPLNRFTLCRPQFSIGSTLNHALKLKWKVLVPAPYAFSQLLLQSAILSALLKKKVFIIHDKVRLHDSGVRAIAHPDRQKIWKNGAAQEMYCKSRKLIGED
jgi:hypothetical protein